MDAGDGIEGVKPDDRAAAVHQRRSAGVAPEAVRGYGSVVEPQPSKLMARVRFPLPAPTAKPDAKANLSQWVSLTG